MLDLLAAGEPMNEIAKLSALPECGGATLPRSRHHLAVQTSTLKPRHRRQRLRDAP